MKKIMVTIFAMVVLTLTTFSQEKNLTTEQKQLHFRYDFYVDKKNGTLSYNEWLNVEKLEDVSGVNYVRKLKSEIDDSIAYRAIILNDSINTPKEGHVFFNNAVKAFTNKQYTDAIRYLTYAINTNINFASAYYLRAIAKAQLKMHIEELIPDMTMACNLGISDACAALKKMRNREEFRHFMFYNTL